MFGKLLQSDQSVGPTYVELRYQFSDRPSLYDFMINECEISPANRVLDDVKTHYKRSQLFLLGLQNKKATELARLWNSGTEFEDERASYMQFYTGAGHEESESESQKGQFKTIYRMFEDTNIHMAMPPEWMDSRLPHHFPCPGKFVLLTRTSFDGYNRREQRNQTVKPGLYDCRAKRTNFGNAGAYFGALIEFLGNDVVDVVVEAKDIYRACRQGDALVVAIMLFHLPTHILGDEKPNWTDDWKSLSDAVVLENDRTRLEKAEALVQEIISVRNSRNESEKNLWASWYYHPVHGTFPDEKLYTTHRRKVNLNEVF